MNKFRAETIEDVLEIMDEIIRNSQVRESRLGYFAALYRTVTRMVKARCDAGGYFEDDDRMRRMDVIFANHYFDSLFSYQDIETNPPAASWKVSFDAAMDPRPTLLQHMLLGMNAHISLDLGIATAKVADGALDDELIRDFYRLNHLLDGLIDVMQDEIAKVSPMMLFLDRALWQIDEFLIAQGMHFARERALKFAHQLATLPGSEWEQAITAQDQLVANISTRIYKPYWFIRPFIWVISHQEKTKSYEIMIALANEYWYEQINDHVTSISSEDAILRLQHSKRETHLMPRVRL